MRVYLNVYDISPMNNYSRVLGLGIYHSCIEINSILYTDLEYSYGFSSEEGSGLSITDPGCLPNASLYQRVFLGETSLSLAEIDEIITGLTESYEAKDYHLLLKNCNHFTNDLGRVLLGKEIPAYVNRSARVMHCLSCMVPPSYWDCYIRVGEQNALLANNNLKS